MKKTLFKSFIGIVSVILVLAMSIAMFVGCGDNTTPTNPDSGISDGGNNNSTIGGNTENNGDSGNNGGNTGGTENNGNNGNTGNNEGNGGNSGGGSSQIADDVVDWVNDYNGYYAALAGNTFEGAEFRSALASIVKGTYKEATDYSGLVEKFKITDEDPDDSSRMIWWYSGTSISKNVSTTNREHVWPKQAGAAFPEKTGPSVDLHHMHPTDAALNSTRNNLQFGVTDTSSAAKQNNITNYTSAITGESGVCYYNGTYFYPSKGMRGATARVLMYVQLAWGDQYSLRFVEGEGFCKTIGDIKTLMQWHLEEPPTEFEKLRNERVFGLQGNRNPFVDYPELAERIYCYDGESYNETLQEVVEEYEGSEEIASIKLNAVSSIAVGETVDLQAVYTPSNAKRDVTWSSSDASVATVDKYGRVTANAVGSATITVTSNANTSISASIVIGVKSLTGIRVEGTPDNTAYDVGKSFIPSGLTVKLLFSDDTTGSVDTSRCEWLDGTTRETTLSAGTTSVICKYNGYEYIVAGIRVDATTGKKITITKASTDCGNSYKWSTWTSDGVSGQIFACVDSKTKKLQMTVKPNTNTVSKIYRYLYNTTPLSNIKKIVITTYSGNNDATFEILTSSTPYDASVTGYIPTSGTSHGSKVVSDTGTTWTFENMGDEEYFTINYLSKVSGKAVLIESIEIYYGE